MNQLWIDILLFIATVVLTYGVRRHALKRAILDIPNHRSSHTVPTPRGGGIGFVVMFYVAIIILWMQHLLPLNALLALGGGIAVAIVGYLDDLCDVRTYWRALVHLLAAIWGIAWLQGAAIFDFGAFSLHLGLMGSVIAVIITVWFINFYNFMDGIDGIAASEAVFVALTAACVLWFLGSSLMYVCFALAATVLGFLVWNWPPARIFMGDIGSGFLGYILAILMWMGNQQQVLPIPFWIILLGVFLCDTTYTLIRRMWQRKKWYESHREHAYQRLIQTGLRHVYVTAGVLIINIVVCLPLALWYFKLYNWQSVLIYLVVLTILTAAVWLWLIRRFPVIEVNKA